jgi:hypothetical protein
VIITLNSLFFQFFNQKSLVILDFIIPIFSTSTPIPFNLSFVDFTPTITPFNSTIAPFTPTIIHFNSTIFIRFTPTVHFTPAILIPFNSIILIEAYQFTHCLISSIMGGHLSPTTNQYVARVA